MILGDKKAKRIYESPVTRRSQEQVRQEPDRPPLEWVICRWRLPPRYQPGFQGEMTFPEHPTATHYKSTVVTQIRDTVRKEHSIHQLKFS